MRRFVKIALTAALMLASLNAFSKAPRFRYGCEWGYSPAVWSQGVYTYLTDMGYRVNESLEPGTRYYTNAFLNFELGVEFLHYFALTAKAGYQGIDYGYRVAPVLIQESFFLKGYENDGPMLIIDQGIGFHSYSLEDRFMMGSAGFGYRHVLSHKVTIDAFIKVSGNSSSPCPYDRYEGVIPRERVIYSSEQRVGCSMGVSLNF